MRIPAPGEHSFYGQTQTVPQVTQIGKSGKVTSARARGGGGEENKTRRGNRKRCEPVGGEVKDSNSKWDGQRRKVSSVTPEQI